LQGTPIIVLDNAEMSSYSRDINRKVYNMKLYKRFYLITVTDTSGKILRTQEEYSGASTSEEMMYLKREYPGRRVDCEYFEVEA
tara:strand:+ start:706 stop:957 length:252 start_codon:yes stop_codon:yes gene_type:complete